MRILHTSDWHLGRSFHREGLLGHQAVFIDHLVEVVRAERVDVVVVAGDVYDRALPPVDAVRLADEALARLADTGAAVVVTNGNHDSALRLGFGSRLMDRAGVHVRTDPAGVGSPLQLADRHGPVLIYPLPYLDPHSVAEAWDLAQVSHEPALREAMDRVRTDRAGRPRARAVVVAHAFVGGGTPSDSERDITVGGVMRVPTDVFDGADYVALGHLHRPQVLTDGLRYSGSPLPYAFSEAGQVKGSWLVELGEHGVVGAIQVPAPSPRPLAVLTADLETLLSDPELAIHEDSWVQAVLTDPIRPANAMERLRRRFPHTLLLEFATRTDPAGSVRGPAAEMEELPLALEFVTRLRGSAPTPAEAALLRRAFDACPHDPDQDRLASQVAR